MPTVKLDNIKPLRGIDNYESWSYHVSLALFAIGAKSLVLTGVTPDNMPSDVADNLSQQALLIIIQLVTAPILNQIAVLSNPHEIWVFFRENYCSDSCFSFVSQMQKIFAVQSGHHDHVRDHVRSHVGDHVIGHVKGGYVSALMSAVEEVAVSLNKLA